MFRSDFIKSKKAGVFLGAFFVLILGFSLFPIKYSLTIEAARPSRNDVLQVFYDIGNGINEADSKLIMLPVVATDGRDSTISRITVPLPAKKIKALRIDPGTGPGTWILKNIILKSEWAGFTLRSCTWLPEDIVRDFAPLHAIDAFAVRNKMLFLNASENDPYFEYKGNLGDISNPLWTIARKIRVTIFVVTVLFACFFVLLHGRTAHSNLKNLVLFIKRPLKAADEIFMRQFLSTRKLVVGACLICTLFFVGLVVCKDSREANRLRFVFDLGASVSGFSQVFYDVGNGYVEADSFGIKVRRGSSQKRAFSLLLSKAIRSIRFDPINSSAVVRINGAWIENKRGDIVKNFSLRDFRPIQQIDKMDIKDGALIVHTSKNANDPIMVIDNSDINVPSNWLNFIVNHIWKILGLSVLMFLVLFGLACSVIKVTSNRYFIGASLGLKSYAIENPKKCIVFVALISAIASCYPVVFFGMSFVSPAGLPLLYPYPPYLPGFPLDVIAENSRGSDIGAMAWSFFPNTVVQHNALIQFLEFPFWNRFVGGGVPLFAQGQSMIGDILHWVPILMGGSALGWDIKFVLSKAIFAMGMGLLVFRLTKSFVAGSLISFSSCFLGFFAFRFNHPAFFVLTYAPWIVLQWDRFGNFLVLPCPRIRSCVMQAFFLAAVTWLQFNAGAPKEGVVLACFMHTLGMICFADYARHRLGWWRSLLLAGGFCLAIVLISSPHWLLFLDALSKSFTLSDVPGANSFSWFKIIGFFDNFFFQKMDGTLGAPSTNLFVMLCLCSSIAMLRRGGSVKLCGAWFLFILALSVAYGLIPKFMLVSIPLINKIQHVFNSFSIPMVVLALILAGFGIRHFIDSDKNHKKMMLMFSLMAFLALWLAYLLMTHSRNTILFFLVAFSVVVVGSWQLRQQAETGFWSKRVLFLLAVFFLLLHVRHGMHLMTGIDGIDNYMQNPTDRASFSNKSEAIEFVKNRIKEQRVPSRVIGEGPVMFPGYNSMLGLEGIVSVEAIRNVYFEKLLTMVDYPDLGWGWLRLIKSDQMASRASTLDLLNVGYVLAAPGTQMPHGVRLIHSGDLDVWERDTVWPRAFFVDQTVELQKPSDILGLLARYPSKPFAALENQPIAYEMPKKNIDRVVVPAQNYSLTSNSTKFSVDATGPGLVVLGETYYPEDFEARLNGKKVNYVRVNESFKGIWIKEAGRYDVSFTYRPEKLGQSLWMCLFGLVLLLLLIWMSVRISWKFNSPKIMRKEENFNNLSDAEF